MITFSQRMRMGCSWQRTEPCESSRDFVFMMSAPAVVLYVLCRLDAAWCEINGSTYIRFVPWDRTLNQRAIPKWLVDVGNKVWDFEVFRSCQNLHVTSTWPAVEKKAVSSQSSATTSVVTAVKPSEVTT